MKLMDKPRLTIQWLMAIVVFGGPFIYYLDLKRRTRELDYGPKYRQLAQGYGSRVRVGEGGPEGWAMVVAILDEPSHGLSTRSENPLDDDTVALHVKAKLDIPHIERLLGQARESILLNQFRIPHYAALKKEYERRRSERGCRSQRTHRRQNNPRKLAGVTWSGSRRMARSTDSTARLRPIHVALPDASWIGRRSRGDHTGEIGCFLRQYADGRNGS